MKEIVAVLVNYNSGELCASAVQSLLAQRDPEQIEIVVVDNASPVDQHQALDPLEALGVTLIFHEENLGYAGGMNLGLAQSAPAEFALLANPDILVRPGAIDALTSLLRADPEIGLAGPRSDLDPGGFWQQPTVGLPTLRGRALDALGVLSSRFPERRARAQLEFQHRIWRAQKPLDVVMLAGSFCFMPYSLARELGPFDPRFPFYFEDADLCRSVRAKGYRLVFEPRAGIVHFNDMSARSARQETLQRQEISKQRYFRKHNGPFLSRLLELAEALAARLPRPGSRRDTEVIEDLGARADPFELDILAGAGGECVLEISPQPDFRFVAGHVDSGASVRFTESGWDAMEGTRWYARVVDAASLEVLRFVSFEKARPAAPPIPFAALPP